LIAPAANALRGPVELTPVSPDTAVILAHYHPRGLIRNDLSGLMRALRALPARVLLVSTHLAPAHRVPAGVEVMVRENHGYDFYSYKVGLEALGDLRGLRRVILMNSSFACLDPEKLIGRFFRGDHTPYDAFALTESEERAPHLQSFLISFNAACMASSAVRAWWGSMAPLDDRREVIDTYELGLSRFLRSAGFALGSAYRPGARQRLTALARSLRRRRWVLNPRALNPTHFYWDFLLKEFGIIKIELIRSDPYALLDEPTRCALSAAVGEVAAA
jgi:lipopolysaccharide biosynthesis protein